MTAIPNTGQPTKQCQNDSPHEAHHWTRYIKEEAAWNRYYCPGFEERRHDSDYDRHALMLAFVWHAGMLGEYHPTPEQQKLITRAYEIAKQEGYT